MARKKIVSEEEVSKPAMAEETTEANADDAAPADLMPGSNAEESITSEATPTETSLEGINGNDAEGSVQTEKPESVSAEKASEEAMPVEDASVSEEELPAESERADASIEEVTTEPESASDALSEAAILHDAGEDGNSVSDMVPREISELHDEAEEAAEYSVDLSEEPETVSPESTPISSTEESDWGFQEPKKEITEEKGLEPPLEAPVPAGRSKIAPKSDRQLFYELKFNNLDRGLPPEERQEWNSIYASYDHQSCINASKHVDTMLTIALHKMINRCECVILLNTGNAISRMKKYEDLQRDTTFSPWIYSELICSSLIQQRRPERHSSQGMQGTQNFDAVNESLQIAYEVPTKHLLPLDPKTLSAWKAAYVGNKLHPLDVLYNQFPQIQKNILNG